jgi:hypothetical protein
VLELDEGQGPHGCPCRLGPTAERVLKDLEDIDSAGLFDRIQAELGVASSATPWNMNRRLGEIGIHFPKHRKRAFAVGETLGVFRD